MILSNTLPKGLYYQSYIVNLQMNTKQKQNVLATIAMVAVVSILSGLSTVQAEKNFMPYGSIGQEDQIYVKHDGYYWVNIVPSQGNGMFMKITDLDSDYSINQAIDRFGINEDSTSFIVQPSVYSNTVFMFELDDNLQFQLVDIYEDNETGFYQAVMERSD